MYLFDSIINRFPELLGFTTLPPGMKNEKSYYLVSNIFLKNELPTLAINTEAIYCW